MCITLWLEPPLHSASLHALNVPSTVATEGFLQGCNIPLMVIGVVAFVTAAVCVSVSVCLSLVHLQAQTKVHVHVPIGCKRHTNVGFQFMDFTKMLCLEVMASFACINAHYRHLIHNPKTTY